jgi:hypothetical protein
MQIKPRNFVVKFKYETPINGVIRTKKAEKIVSAYDICDAVMIVKDMGEFREVSEIDVYKVSRLA